MLLRHRSKAFLAPGQIGRPPGFLPSLGLLLACLFAQTPQLTFAAAVDSGGSIEKPPAKPSTAGYDDLASYQEQSLEGWRVLVNQKLLAEKELCSSTLKLLGLQLEQITRAVPEKALFQLRQIPIWVERSSSQFPCMCYHESREWLETHGVNPAKTGAVELANPTNFLSWSREQPWMVLHELAHGYHQRVLGENHESIQRCYEHAKAAKLYDSVLRINGSHEPHYALTNAKEYFAEMTEAFFGVNDFYPFVRAELREHDPLMFDLLCEVWGVEDTRNHNLPPHSRSAVADPREFVPGQVWLDTQGNPINAHGGGILLHQGVYYWYGEARGPRASTAVSCYTSTNLADWEPAGAVLPATSLPRVNDRRTFVERPKVLFNPGTKKFVMWMHLEQGGYRFSRAGIALCDSPVGNFTFLNAFRPIANTNDFASLSPDPSHQAEFGATFRDMNLFLDDDGRAYVFYSAEDNWTMYVVRLNNDFTGPELPAVENKTWAKILVRRMREGAAPFKHRGKYFLISSACTGWRANQADCAVADNVLGPYCSLGNPCDGPNSETTFGAQSTFVLPVPRDPALFIFIADRWDAANLPDSRYVWLPLEFDRAENPVVRWREHWALPLTMPDSSPRDVGRRPTK